MYIKDEKLYKTLVYITQVAIPALATFCFAIASIWDISGVDKVVGTLTALDAVMGKLLMISSKNYKGVNEDEKEGFN